MQSVIVILENRLVETKQSSRLKPPKKCAPSLGES